MKFLHYFYYRVYQVCVGISDDFLNSLKPFAVVWIIEALFLLEGLLWFTPLTGIKFDINVFVGIIVVGALFISNLLIFPHDKIMKQESREFKQYPKSRKTLWDICSILIILGTIAFTIFSFYKFSQMDWSKYRH